jgi:membrane-bound ClpP family serine protease
MVQTIKSDAYESNGVVPITGVVLLLLKLQWFTVRNKVLLTFLLGALLVMLGSLLAWGWGAALFALGVALIIQAWVVWEPESASQQPMPPGSHIQEL